VLRKGTLGRPRNESGNQKFDQKSVFLETFARREVGERQNMVVEIPVDIRRVADIRLHRDEESAGSQHASDLEEHAIHCCLVGQVFEEIARKADVDCLVVDGHKVVG